MIEHTGDVYSCDFFVEPSWLLGNVHNQAIINMLNSPHQKQFGLRKTLLAETCKVCKWLTTCNGGCPKDRLNNVRNPELSGFCEAYQLFFEYADGKLRALARQWKEAQPPPPPQGHSNLLPKTKISRNQPCPCGSGKKYKKCCMSANSQKYR